jgi:hypothetical protein
VRPPLAVPPGEAEGTRGELRYLSVGAPGRTRVTVEWQAVGDVPRAERIDIEGDAGRGAIGPVDAPIRYRVRAPDGAVTPLFHARPVDPLLVSALSVELVHPRHTGREPERLSGELPPLTVTEGTVLRLDGRSTRPLAAASLRRSDGAERGTRVAGAGFWGGGGGGAGPAGGGRPPRMTSAWLGSSRPATGSTSAPARM